MFLADMTHSGNTVVNSECTISILLQKIPGRRLKKWMLLFKIRHTPEFMKGKLVQEGGNYRIISSDNLQGIAPGQFGVVYDEASRICIGSGEICV